MIRFKLVQSGSIHTILDQGYHMTHMYHRWPWKSRFTCWFSLLSSLFSLFLFTVGHVQIWWAGINKITFSNLFHIIWISWKICFHQHPTPTIPPYLTRNIQLKNSNQPKPLGNESWKHEIYQPKTKPGFPPEPILFRPKSNSPSTSLIYPTRTEFSPWPN